jgi:hypothetical protein
MFDGITGLVTQPMAGAKKEGAAGFVKGIGKGIGGIVLKPGAAIFGIPAYTMKGVYKELQQLSGSSVQNYIIAARTAQGYDEWHRSTVQERQDIIRRWKIVEAEVKKKKFVHEQFQDMLRKQWENAHRDDKDSSGNQGRRPRSLLGMALRSRANSHEASAGSQGDVVTPSVEVTQPPSYNDLAFTRGTGSEDMETAIQTSVANTSRGDAEQDAMIERAIRASIAELSVGSTRAVEGNSNASTKVNPDDDDEDEMLCKAIAASMADDEDTFSDHDEQLAAALEASLQQQTCGAHKDKRTKHQDKSVNKSEWKTSWTSTDDDAELQRVIAQSKKDAQSSNQSLRAEEEEERIVLEYVKKQSLIEEQHGRSQKGKGKVEEKKRVDEDNDDEEDDEDFKRAMEMSLAQEGRA